MRAFAKNEIQTLSLIAPRPSANQKAVIDFVSPNRPERSMRALRPVESNESRRPRLSTPDIMRRLSRLSVVDVTRVNQATIREGEGHCVWPPEVLEKIRAAEIITEKTTPHYILREVNVTRVK